MIYFYENNKIFFDKVLFVLGSLVFFYVFFVYIFGFISPFLFAFIFSLALEPLVNFFNVKLNFCRGFSAMLCLILLIFTMIIFVNFLFNILWNEAIAFINSLPYYVNETTEVAENIRLKYYQYLEFIPDGLRNLTEKISPMLIGFGTNIFSSGLKGGSLQLFTSLPNFLMWVSICFISTFFFIKDKYFIRQKVVDCCPLLILKYYQMFRKGFFGAIGGYIKAQFSIMSIIALINIFGMIILDYPYALFMGVIIALIDVLPIFGSGIILIPWGVFSLIGGDVRYAFSIFLLYGVNLVTRQLLEPKVISKEMGIYPIVTLVSIYIGIKVFGMMGFFIGPLIVIMINSMSKYDV